MNMKKILLAMAILLTLNNSAHAIGCAGGSLSPSHLSNCGKICNGDSEPWRTLCLLEVQN